MKALLLLILLLVLVACSGSDDALAPTVAILTPPSGSPVSGTTTVQLTASDDLGVREVRLYVRARGSSGRGVQVGSANQEPYTIAWYTLAQPNLAELELVGVAVDLGGNEGESQPVRVWVQNSDILAGRASCSSGLTMERVWASAKKRAPRTPPSCALT